MKEFRKVDIMIIGAQKAGTTSLKNYLNEHPQILGHLSTEFPYFITDNIYEKEYKEIFNQYFTEGNIETYKKVAAKAVGMSYNETAIKRLYEHNPDCKLVFIIRNPTARTYSAFNMELANGWLKKNFDELIKDVRLGKNRSRLYRLFIGLSQYHKHLNIIWKYFPRQQVKIITFDKLKQQPVEVCKDIFEWIGVDSNFTPNTEVVHNKTGKAKSSKISAILTSLRNNNNLVKKAAKWLLPYKWFTRIGNSMIEFNKSKQTYEPLKPEHKKILDDHFYPMIQELEKETGLNLSHWYKES